MVSITIDTNSAQEYTAFHCVGHTGYAEAGEDIVCAAVSVLVINTINSIEHLVSDAFDLSSDQETGRIDFSLREGYSRESLLFLQSLALGLQGIQQNYGTEYLKLTFKEV